MWLNLCCPKVWNHNRTRHRRTHTLSELSLISQGEIFGLTAVPDGIITPRFHGQLLQDLPPPQWKASNINIWRRYGILCVWILLSSPSSSASSFFFLTVGRRKVWQNVFVSVIFLLFTGAHHKRASFHFLYRVFVFFMTSCLSLSRQHGPVCRDNVENHTDAEVWWIHNLLPRPLVFAGQLPRAVSIHLPRNAAQVLIRLFTHKQIWDQMKANSRS